MSGAAETIHEDVSHDSFDDDGEDVAVNAFLNLLEDDAKRPSEGKPEATDPKATEAAPESDTSEDTESDAETTEDNAEEADDEPKVVVKVDGEERQVPVKDLTRLYGQEAALTRKSQELAAARTVADQTASRASAALTKLLEKAKADYEPYTKVDYLRESHRLPEDAWNQLRQDALAAQQNLTFLTEELDGHMRAEGERLASQQREVAQATLQAFSAPPDKGGIEGWSQTLYAEMMDYAATVGIPKDRAMGIVDAAPLRMLHKAMLYDRDQAARSRAAAKVEKVKQFPQKVARPGGASNGNPKGKLSDAIAQLRKSGSDDDGVDAWLAMDSRD